MVKTGQNYCQDPTCGKTLDEIDMAQASCQSCGEMLTPETIVILREQFGQAQQTPDITPPPVPGPEVPDEVECENPDCEMPLAGQDMMAYESGQPCIYCGVPKNQPTPAPMPTPAPTPSQPDVPAVDPSAVVPSTNVATIHMMVNSGPLAKHNALLKLPIAQDIGRNTIKSQLQELCTVHGEPLLPYEKAIDRISRSHFKFHFDSTNEALSVEDLNSTNFTYVDRNQITGGQVEIIDCHQMLVLAGELYLVRPGQYAVTHRDTGVKLHMTGPETIDKSTVTGVAKIELGRLQSDGSHTAFAKAIMKTMEDDPNLDHDEFRRVSRRHATLELTNGEFILNLEQDKTAQVEMMATGGPPSVIDVNHEQPYVSKSSYFSFTLGNQVFIVR